MGKINIPADFYWQPVFNETARSYDVTVPVGAVDDFRLVRIACFEDARKAKARSVF